MKLNISERDLKLLLFVLILALVGGGWWGSKKIKTTNEQTKLQVAELEKRYTDLKSKHINFCLLTIYSQRKFLQ